MIEPRRTIVWWSSGAASAIAAWLTLKDTPDAIIARCETFNEDPDNLRFEADVMRWLGCAVTLLKSDKYSSVWDVWQKRRYMAGIKGAPCTSEMKLAPRLAFQRPTDIHIFGYTADPSDVKRFERLKENYPELTLRAPLITRGITKAISLALIERYGIALPRTYAMGFPNANCLQTGCVKATSPNYWALYRQQFPENFARTAAYARQIGARLAKVRGERVFIDEIPADWPTTKPIVPACDFLCATMEKEEMSDTGNPRAVTGANQLRDYVTRLCNVEEEIAERRGDLKELYHEAKGNGFEPAALRAIVKREREDASKAEKRKELEALIGTYSSALGIMW